MPTGILYYQNNGEAIVEVDYRFYDESPSGWWGELIFKEYRRVRDGDGYVIEFEDGRKGSCLLTKRVNRAVSGTPPLYYYYFRGMSQLRDMPMRQPPRQPDDAARQPDEAPGQPDL